MRTFRTLAIILFGSFIGGALLAPPVFELLHFIDPTLTWPYSRVFSRVATLLALLLMFALKREFDFPELIARLNPRSIGWSKCLRLIGIGAVLSFGASLLLFPFVLSPDGMLWAGREGSELFWKFLRLIPVVLFIGLIEESFFRGLLFGAFSKSLSPVGAALLVSTLYAVLHFISPLKGFEYQHYSPLVGFDYLSGVVSRMLMPELLPAMFGLFLIGLTLTYVVYKSGNLFLAIGLHAGWVMAAKMIAEAATFAPTASVPLGVGRRYYLISTPYSWISILLVWGLCALLLSRIDKKKGGNGGHLPAAS